MAKKVNKVVVNGTTKLDLTSDDVTEADVASGKKFHKADGTEATGEASFPSLPLTVANGGTGKTTLTSNSVLAGDGTNAVKNISSASGALYATASGGGPKFGTLPVAQGGTGSSYSDFASLCDAVGSGGNWVDVSTKLYNETIMTNSNFFKSSCTAHIYEKKFLAMRFRFYCDVSLTEWRGNIANVPTWAKPKNIISCANPYGMSLLYDAFYLDTHFTCAAGNDSLIFALCYVLDSPYSE